MWDYPRPPRLEEFSGSITVELGGQTIASTTRAWRVLETSHPPTYYLPADCFSEDCLRPASGSSWCEWKGQAAHVDRCTVNGEQVIPQPGGFYGGWVTSWIAGPFKGVPGSMGW